MNSQSQTEYRPNYAVAPGAVLDEHREAAGMTQAALGQRLGFSTKHINRLLHGREPVTPETALKLATVFGLPAHVWLGMEARYREHLARAQEEQNLADELPWLEQLPHRALTKLGWLPKGLRGTELVRALREFFSVGSLTFLPAVWGNVQVSYRKTKAFTSDEWAVAAWLAQGDRKAKAIDCQPFDASALRAALPRIKALSRMHGSAFVEPLIQHCADVGVAVVLLPAPEGARVSGATRWMTKEKRFLVQLSLRYKADDQLWFTLFHEFGHVLLHGKRQQFIDFERVDHLDRQEQEANDFAARSLIAPTDLARFIETGDVSHDAIVTFAEAQGIAPGIVVGQLQHQSVVPYNSMLNKLKTRYQWDPETGSF